MSYGVSESAMFLTFFSLHNDPKLSGIPALRIRGYNFINLCLKRTLIQRRQFLQRMHQFFRLNDHRFKPFQQGINGVDKEIVHLFRQFPG